MPKTVQALNKSARDKIKRAQNANRGDGKANVTQLKQSALTDIQRAMSRNEAIKAKLGTGKSALGNVRKTMVKKTKTQSEIRDIQRQALGIKKVKR